MINNQLNLSEPYDNSNYNSLKSPAELNKAYLINRGILPTSEEAKKIFWSLGNDWWKPIIDGKFHQYGQMVFDKGLHNGSIEPGYISGIENACFHFVDNFDKEFNVKLYKEIHHIACEHFSINKDSGIICDKDHIDTYRTDSEGCYQEIINPELAVLQKELEEVDEIHSNLGYYRRFLRGLVRLVDEGKMDEFNIRKKNGVENIEEIKLLFEQSFNRPCGNMDPQEIKDLFEFSDEIFENLSDKKKALENILEKKIISHKEDLNENFKKIAVNLGFQEPFVACTVNSLPKCAINYRSAGYFNFEEITKKIINKFNNNLESLQKNTVSIIQDSNLENSTADQLIKVKEDYKGEVVTLIGQLFAELEWAHPWIDGQGRTDLISLNGLLAREGLHPCILEEPYYSTNNNENDWIEYLKGGLAKFEELKANIG